MSKKTKTWLMAGAGAVALMGGALGCGRLDPSGGPLPGELSEREQLRGLAFRILVEITTHPGEAPFPEENREIARWLTGEPWPRNGAGELIDRWSTPYRVVISRTGLVVLSAGVDRDFGTADDLMQYVNLEHGAGPNEKTAAMR